MFTLFICGKQSYGLVVECVVGGDLQPAVFRQRHPGDGGEEDEVERLHGAKVCFQTVCEEGGRFEAHLYTMQHAQSCAQFIRRG